MNNLIVNTKMGKTSTILDTHDSRIFIVNSRLGEFVKKIRSDKRFSVDDVQNNSRKGGKKGISAAYVNKLENDPSVNPTTPKLEALADGLLVTHEEIFAVARGTKPNQEKIDESDSAGIFRDLNNLSPAKKQLAKKQIRAIIDAMKEDENFDFNYIDD